MGRLDDQSILVTGGASGLGRAIVERYLAEGASVSVFDKSADALTRLSGDFPEVVTITGDVRSLADNRAAVAAAVERFGALDCAVGNAGIWDFQKSLVDLPDAGISEAFDEIFQVNVLGYLNLAKAALKQLTQSRGSMIFTVSNAGFYAGGGGPLYTASKHAVVGIIRQLAYELGPYIRVNGVAPGAINTNLRGPASLGYEDRIIPGAAIAAAIPDHLPVGVMPTPADYAGAWVFFAARQDHIPATGTILNHDGGVGVRGLMDARKGDELPVKLGLEP